MPTLPDPRQVNLTPAELHAIQEHKYFLSLERGAEVSIEEAIQSFLRRFAEDWRREKARRDSLAQRSEIERLQHLRATEEGRLLDPSAAAEHWCERYAAIWRAERESLERNGFQCMKVTVRNPEALHVRPWSAVATTVASYDCDVYVHTARMPYCNFRLEGRPFMNVKSVVGMLSLGIALGDTLEFIAMGAQAGPALARLRTMVGEAAMTPAPDR
jgi:phosphotransferase system HPr (HPr) family protein